MVACAGDVEHVEAGVGIEEPLKDGGVDRERPLAAADDEEYAVVRREPQPLARCLPVGLDHGARDGPARHEVALALESRDRKRQADPARPAGEEAVGETEVAVCLGDDERKAEPHRRDPDGRRHVAATAKNRIRLAHAEDGSRSGHGLRREREGPGGAQRVRTIDAPHAKVVDLVPGLGHKRRLGPLRGAGESDEGAVSPQRVGDCQRGHYVPGRAARCYYDSGLVLIGCH